MRRVLFTVLLLIRITFGFIDPFSIGTAIGGGLAYQFSSVIDSTFCKFTECCNDEYIPRDIGHLSEQLNSKLIGQHIVIQQLIPALKGHFSKTPPAKKALVLSLHGTAGTGKNYVADLMASSLYKKGRNSNFVHFYKGKADFSIRSKSEEYATNLKNEVTAAIANCPRSLFIFDEVEKMAPGILEPLSSLVDYSSMENSQAIFVFLSNTAGVNISSHLISLMLEGKLRENSKLSDFESIIQRVAYDEENGMKEASLLSSYLVDHYIPFLPLEKEHVYRCLEKEFMLWGRKPDCKIISNIIQESVPFDKETKNFALSGCKNLHSKVQVEVNN